MSIHKAKFKCMHCGEHDLGDDDFIGRLDSGKIGTCPKCGKFEYGNGITFTGRIKAHDWKFARGGIVA